MLMRWLGFYHVMGLTCFIEDLWLPFGAEISLAHLVHDLQWISVLEEGAHGVFHYLLVGRFQKVMLRESRSLIPPS